MKWNWGTKLFIATALFMIMIIWFGVLMMRESISLVERDYYPKAQEFQKQIERRSNGVAFIDAVNVSLQDQRIVVAFPAQFLAEGLKGNLHMYNRIDENKDAEFEFSFAGDSVFVFPVAPLNGRYIAKLTWSFQGKEYYIEKPLTIQ